MNIFISESTLDNKYKCYGHFYSINYAEKKCSCRSVLEIVNLTKVPNDPNDLQKLKPNAIFIMMNPGESYPIENILCEIEPNEMSFMQTKLVLAHPDRTQYQLMRVMEVKGWNHVRVLNLSDLRDPDSGSFYNYFAKVANYEHGEVHSCFSELRRKELMTMLNIVSPIFAAWGVSYKLRSLIENCVISLVNKNELKGIKKIGTTDKYYHPLLRGNPFNQIEWLKKIIRL